MILFFFIKIMNKIRKSKLVLSQNYIVNFCSVNTTLFFFIDWYQISFDSKYIQIKFTKPSVILYIYVYRMNKWCLYKNHFVIFNVFLSMFIALLNAGPGHLILKSQDHGMASWHLIRNATSVLFAIGKILHPPVLVFISPIEFILS